MIHILDDTREYATNADRRMVCGIVGKLPEGDVFWYPTEAGARRSDCPGCNPGGPEPFGTPISQLSGRPGYPGFERFKAFAASWGYD